MSQATPFTKILIANRGEIALRVMRSARALGYRTVAVYSSADAQAQHVGQADQAVCIGAPAPRESYLNIAAIIAAARLSGADAVHPGYGFLAENEAFAAACRDAGLVFVGPSPEAIRAMGDKAGAKALMTQAGVPCIRGYQGIDQSEARLAVEAAAIGWPVMIKATAGGGGRGMRLVTRAQDFAEALQRARSEALGAFGDDTVLLEHAIVEPRHIEIQVFADRHGHAIHLGERDCSVQRRHQKLIEESPSPAVTPELRDRMGALAVKAALAIAYEGAGTFEFLLDREGQFFFMEMNTRLQVEHAVTEAITGLDLVAWQLQVAAGGPLPLTQDQVRWQGHAIEVRLCAEDAQQNFMPQSGRMLGWRMPDADALHRAGLRVDHALRSGDEIPPHYDSMIAKLVSHGATREEALRKLVCGLQDALALGVTTNQAFLVDALTHPVFAAGQATTAFIGQQGAQLLARPAAELSRCAAAVAAVLLNWGPGTGHRLPVLCGFDLDGQKQQVRLTQRGSGDYTVSLAGRDMAIKVSDVVSEVLGEVLGEVPGEVLGDAPSDTPVDRAPSWSARIGVDGLTETVTWLRDGHRLCLHWRGRAWSVDDHGRVAAASRAVAVHDGKLRATMNGRVVAVQVAVGDSVQAGQALITLEAMKMEHVHAAPQAGVVSALQVAVGEQVAARRVMVEIEPSV